MIGSNQEFIKQILDSALKTIEEKSTHQNGHTLTKNSQGWSSEWLFLNGQLLSLLNWKQQKQRFTLFLL